MKRGLFVVAILAVVFAMISCGPPTSDQTQQERQEQVLQVGVQAVGTPAITNFFEMKQLKHIYELRDQDGYVTYTYLENLVPTVIKGKTALGGKLTFMGDSIGYGIPYATQFTSPSKIEWYRSSYLIMPQADPNGLYPPSSAAGTWILMLDPVCGKDLKPIYSEPNVIVSPFKWPVD
jgi:hypothetical protein